MRLTVLFAVALAASVVGQDEVSEGQRLYFSRCVPCHQRKKIDFHPSAYSQRGLWQMVANMAGRANIDYYDQLEITSYLESVRAGRAKLPGTSLSPTSTNEFAVAQQLYVAKCASCHAHKVEPINPGKYNEAKWKEWMQKMSPISKLTPAETELVGRYLEAVRAGKAALPVPTGAQQK